MVNSEQVTHNMAQVSQITSGAAGNQDYETIKGTARVGAVDSEMASHEVSHMLPASIEEHSPERVME